LTNFFFFLDSLTLAQESTIPQRYTPPQTSPLPPGFGLSSHPSNRMPMSLEEIEAQLHRQAGLPEKKMLSLAEVEAALMGINGRPQQLPIHPTTEAVYREETIAYLEQEAALREQEALLYHRERKRREKQRKLVEMVIFLISCLTFFINNPLINLIYLKLVQI
jgi:hypothetical protein